jgi:hypothetical protein
MPRRVPEPPDELAGRVKKGEIQYEGSAIQDCSHNSLPPGPICYGGRNIGSKSSRKSKRTTWEQYIVKSSCIHQIGGKDRCHVSLCTCNGRYRYGRSLRFESVSNVLNQATVGGLCLVPQGFQYLYGASFLAGYRASIFRIIFSAIEMELAMAASIPGHGLSNCASLRAARIVAAIKRTRLRPSSMPHDSISSSLFVRP